MMVVVVPSFTHRNREPKTIITTVIFGVVSSRSPHEKEINCKSAMKKQYCAQHKTIEEIICSHPQAKAPQKSWTQ